MKGVIIDRRVNIGQTVVSSLNAPSLFLIAQDLRRMQVWAAVNEADIGNIHPGELATFTVDARAGHTFDGKVLKVRLDASMTQNVVTYTVEIATDNDAGLLLPYLTANVTFVIGRATGALTVPNAALRWSPPADRIEGAASVDHRHAGKDGEKHGVLWQPVGGFVRPIAVRAGISDGVVTAVDGDGVSEGTPVVVGDERPATAPAATGSTSPFTPQMRRGR